jgi:hypothetical protein
MRSHTISAILFALTTMILVIAPAFAHRNHGYRGYHYHQPYYGGAYYANPYGYGYPSAYPVYNNYAYRGYAPYGEYGYYPPNHTARNVAIGAGIGAAVGLLASPHGHRY